MYKNRINKGFTLAELLIVIAIIAVLVGIMFPVFSGSIEKAAEAKDISTARSIYAELRVEALLNDTSQDYDDTNWTRSFALSQSQDDWQTSNVVIGEYSPTDKDNWIGTPKKGGTCKIVVEKDTYNTIFYWEGSGSSSGGSGSSGTPSTPSSSSLYSTASLNSTTYLLNDSNNCIAGNIYSDGTTIYVCNTDNTSDYASLSGHWEFVELTESALNSGNILTNDNSVPRSQWDNTQIFIGITRGTIYFDGTDYYIFNQPGPSDSGLPVSEPTLWQKINLN
ncbi:MAG: prepilin-type N-terminal cleavage/methylation domain-containing protein [Erysipelotrichaceae bacterium]|nr:prepilin-type N-terminal cleavage/methylation domain-containing protein [Erysipelotrichaceae bacterium]